MPEKIKVGIWGLGRAGYSMHAKGELVKFPDEFEIAAACDIEEIQRKRMADAFPKTKIYSDGDEFLKDPNVDLFSIAVRSPQHVDYAIRALETGKYVFAEKPVALTVEGAEKLLEASKKHPGKLFYRQNRRFEPAFNHIMQIMKSGILGEVYEIKMCRHSYSFRNDWQAINDCGGGQLNNWGPHLIDQALQFLESPVESVWSDLKCIATPGDAEDHLKIIFRGQNKRVIDIEISNGVALPAPVYSVYGTRGSLISEDELDIKLKYLRPEFKMPKEPAHRESPLAGFDWGVKPDFIRKTIMCEPEPPVDITDIYHHIYEAIRLGKPFRVKEEEAMNVVKWTEVIKRQNPDFPLCKDVFGCKTY